MRPQVFLALALALAACSPSNTPQTGSQTNWLISCDSSNDCEAGVECVCGACTRYCQTETACGDLAGTSCVASDDQGSIALCSGQVPLGGVCLPRCDESSCEAGKSCIAGVCVPSAKPAVRVELDTGARHQALIGFGAGLAYADDRIVENADKSALYDLFFEDAGFSVLRLSNRYVSVDDHPVEPAKEIVDAASERLGRAPFLFMTSGTPPQELKANGTRTCSGDPATCTLVTLPGGAFDYAGFANYWRSSLEVYAAGGIEPDFISIQNNPNWVPPEAVDMDACYFLPEEGTTEVTVDGVSTEVAYPGYREALAAVQSAIAELASVPQIGAPETGVVGVGDFVPPLGASELDALAFHFYGIEAESVDVAALETLRDLASELDRPVFQTEMMADGFDTALLAHYALANSDAALYLQNDLASVDPENPGNAFVLLTDGGFEAQGPYFALRHYSKNTAPGWVRVDAGSDSNELLSSAWLAPDESGLTLVLVNSGSDDLETEVVLPNAVSSEFVRSEVTRTVFDGVERAASLGALPANRTVRVPARSIVTVAFTSD